MFLFKLKQCAIFRNDYLFYNGIRWICFAQFWIMRNSFASCNTYTFQIIQVKDNPPLFVYFLIQFSDWEVKAAEDFHMLNSFPFKNKIILGHSIFAFSFCLTNAYYLCSVLIWEKTLSIFRFLIMFPLNLLSVCSMCMVCQPSVP